MSECDNVSLAEVAERDPEIWSEFLALRRAQDTRRRLWEGDQRALRGVGDVLPEVFEAEAAPVLLQRAAAEVGRRRAFQASPEGRFCAGLGRIADALVSAGAALEAARAARARAFEAEADLCRSRAEAVFEASRRLGAAALDAALAAGEVQAH